MYRENDDNYKYGQLKFGKAAAEQAAKARAVEAITLAYEVYIKVKIISMKKYRLKGSVTERAKNSKLIQLNNLISSEGSYSNIAYLKALKPPQQIKKAGYS